VDLMFVNPKVAVISTGAFDGVEISNTCIKLANVNCNLIFKIINTSKFNNYHLKFKSNCITLLLLIFCIPVAFLEVATFYITIYFKVGFFFILLSALWIFI
jgi:hypothetical protein